MRYCGGSEVASIFIQFVDLLGRSIGITSACDIAGTNPKFVNFSGFSIENDVAVICASTPTTIRIHLF